MEPIENTKLEVDKEVCEAILSSIIDEDNVENFQQICQMNRTVNVVSEGNTALTIAVRRRSFRIFNYLLSQRELKVDLTIGHQTTALVYAILGFCTAGDESHKQAQFKYLILGLLRRKANINLLNEDGHGPLIRACCLGTDACIHLLIWHGADPTIPSKSGLRSYHAAAGSYCAEETLEALLKLNHEDEEPIDLHLLTIATLVHYGHIPFLEQILPRLAKLHVLDQNCVQKLLEQLHKLPFWLFMDMVQKFSNLLEALKMCESLDVTPLTEHSPELVEYLTFLLQHCHNLKDFHATPLLSVPEKLPYELLHQLLFTVLSHGRAVILDLDQVYGLYQFSLLFENLLYMNIVFSKDIRKPYFVPVWYNLVMEAKPPWTTGYVFEDQRFYFAGKCGVPSLIQLTRDHFRYSLIREHNLTTPLQVYDKIRELPIVDDFKDILMFKSKIYS